MTATEVRFVIIGRAEKKDYVTITAEVRCQDRRSIDVAIKRLGSNPYRLDDLDAAAFEILQSDLSACQHRADQQKMELDFARAETQQLRTRLHELEKELRDTRQQKLPFG